MFLPRVDSRPGRQWECGDYQAGSHRPTAPEGDEVITRYRIRLTNGSGVAGRGRRRVIQRLAFEVSVVIITAAITYTMTSWLTEWLAGAIH